MELLRGKRVVKEGRGSKTDSGKENDVEENGGTWEGKITVRVRSGRGVEMKIPLWRSSTWELPSFPARNPLIFFPAHTQTHTAHHMLPPLPWGGDSSPRGSSRKELRRHTTEGRRKGVGSVACCSHSFVDEARVVKEMGKRMPTPPPWRDRFIIR